MIEAMAVYDREVFNPALVELQARCVEENGGHEKTRSQIGYFTTSWICGHCGAMFGHEDINW